MTVERGHAACRVVQVGPSLGAHGGIAAVLRAYAESSLASRYELIFVGTRAQGGSAGAWVRSVLGVLHACWLALSLERPAVFHIHVASRGSFARKVIVLAVARACRRPTIVHLHGGMFHHFATGGGRLRRALVRWMFGVADSVLVLSPEWQDRVADFAGRKDAVTVPNPVRVPSRPADPRTPPRVVFLGRLGAQKGVPELVEAIRILQAAGVDADWMLAGDGDVEATRAAVAALPSPERIEVPGWVDHDVVTGILSSAAVFCLPSHDEGKPISLLEAMAWGLPCVATPVGGVPDLLHDTEDGLLVPVGDPVALAEALRRLLEDPVLRGRLGGVARERVRAEYDVENVVTILSDIYDGLCAGGAPAPSGFIHAARTLFDLLPAPLKKFVGALARHLPVRLRYGSRFVADSAFAREVDHWGHERVVQEQSKLLRSLSTAAMATEYWPGVFARAGIHAGPSCPEELRLLPLLDKDQVKKLGDALVSFDVAPSSRKWVTTGGTSGKPLGLWIDRDSSVTDWAYTVHAWGRIGFKLDEPRVVLRGVRFEAAGKREVIHHEPLRREVYLSVFDMDAGHLPAMRQAIASSGARYIHGYPSAMEVLGRSYIESGDEVPLLSGLLAVSENLTDPQRAWLERVFRCRVFTFYGMTEKGAFAAECEYSTELHVEPLFGVLELVDDQGSVIDEPNVRGEIVVTSLITHATPLIRYRTGDYGSWSGRSECECGRPHRRLNRVEGRWRREFLVGAGGERISMTAINVHSGVFDRVRRFQFVQEKAGVATLLIEGGDGFDPASDVDRILAELEAKLSGHIVLEPCVVDRVPQTERGKQLFIDQRITGGE